MTIDDDKIERRPNATALGRWENEGGALGQDSMDIQYGRRVESDGSWTVYHVFTGNPARVDGQTLTGMSRSDATKGMLSLNLINTARRRKRTRLSKLALTAHETIAGQS